MTQSHVNFKTVTGYCLIGTGLFAALGFILHPHDSIAQNQAMWMFSHLLIMIGLFSNNIGLAGLYILNQQKLGRIGLIGFLITSFALFLYIGKLYWSGFIYPLVVAEHPEFIEKIGFGPGSDPKHTTIKALFFAGAFSFALGHLLLGFALLRAKLFKPAPIYFLMVGAVLVGIWPLMPNVVQMLSIVVSAIYAFGVVWLGMLFLKSAKAI